MPVTVLPDSRVNVIVRDDDCIFGLLHSRFHELWSLRLGGWHGVGNDPQYTPSSGFETFPFPEGLTPDILPADYARSEEHTSELQSLMRTSYAVFCLKKK